MTEQLLSLLYSFLQIGFFSIGGGYATIPLIRQQVIDLHAWLTMQEFTDIITISQMTPGPLAVNTSTFVGMRIAGLGGAAAATFGCIISGYIISLFLYRFFKKHQQTSWIQPVLSGLKSASVGLIASCALTIVALAFQSDTKALGLPLNLTAVVLFALSFFALRKWKIHPILLMALCGLAGIFLY
ncbi:chromate transporter [Diplocloster hominis]|uniref:chromate transporter n=1 Tax=Diplocloster hominis TaxID=3079010 RepID=UPI0031BB42DB